MSADCCADSCARCLTPCAHKAVLSLHKASLSLARSGAASHPRCRPFLSSPACPHPPSQAPVGSAGVSVQWQHCRDRASAGAGGGGGGHPCLRPCIPAAAVAGSWMRGMEGSCHLAPAASPPLPHPCLRPRSSCCSGRAPTSWACTPGMSTSLRPTWASGSERCWRRAAVRAGGGGRGPRMAVQLTGAAVRANAPSNPGAAASHKGCSVTCHLRSRSPCLLQAPSCCAQTCARRLCITTKRCCSPAGGKVASSASAAAQQMERL